LTNTAKSLLIKISKIP